MFIPNSCEILLLWDLNGGRWPLWKLYYCVYRGKIQGFLGGTVVKNTLGNDASLKARDASLIPELG